MKYLSETDLERPGSRLLAAGEKFAFRCHERLACFNRCCHNLNLLLYPYDLLRIKKNLKITSDALIEEYSDIVLREGQHFPEVLLRMADSRERPCIFLKPTGCGIYADRPHTCRFFPVEQGVCFDAASGRSSPVYYLRPPAFCLGPEQEQLHTIDSYTRNQQARLYDDMTTRWAEIRRLMQTNPCWDTQGPHGAKARMAFMASYNMDSFREFVFRSSFLKRYRVPAGHLSKIRRSETELLLLGFDWIKLFLWGLPSNRIRPANNRMDVINSLLQAQQPESRT